MSNHIILEERVPNYEISKKLQSLGLSQNNRLYYWTYQPYINVEKFVHEGPGQNKDDIPTLDIVEMGKILPMRITINNGRQIYTLRIFKQMRNGKEEWVCRYENLEGTGFWNACGKTEADARGEMLIRLIQEHKLIL